MAAAHSVGLARGVIRSSTRDQRPWAAGGVERRNRNGRCCRSRRVRAGGATNARTACKASLVTSPAHARSHRAATISSGNPPPSAAWIAGEERGPFALEVADDVRGEIARGVGPRGRREQAQVIREVQREASVSFAERLHAHPRDLARGDQVIEVGRLVTGDARREDLGLDERGGQWSTLELVDGIEQCVEPEPRPGHSLPRRGEAPERLLLDGLDLVPQARERALPQCAQDIGFAPLAVRAPGTELAVHDPPGRPRAARASPRSPRGLPEACRRRLGRERPVRARVPRHEIAERIAHRPQQRLGDALGQRRTERVAVPRGVLGGDQPSSPATGTRRMRRARSSAATAAAGSSIVLRARISASARSPIRSSRSWIASACRA